MPLSHIFEEMTWEDKLRFMFESRINMPSMEGILNGMVHGKLVSADEVKKVYITEFKIERWMENPRGELHGGALATIFDTVAGNGSVSVAETPNIATLDLYINYLSRMEGTDTVVCNARIVRAGRRFIRITIDAFSKSTGTLIATCTANFAVLAEDSKRKVDPILMETDGENK